MPLLRYRTDYLRLDAASLAAWSDIPAALASDCMNRQQTMAARIAPIAPGMKMVGQARTVRTTAGGNGPIRAALGLLQKGDVLVVDAAGFLDRAVWGGLLGRAAVSTGCAGLVFDGAVRDVAELRALGLPCFAAGVVPAGPHKDLSGEIDGAISCAGCTVHPGDIVIGDDDGIAVVPLAQAEAVLAAAQEKLAAEQAIMDRLDQGSGLVELFGLPEARFVD